MMMILIILLYLITEQKVNGMVVYVVISFDIAGWAAVLVDLIY